MSLSQITVTAALVLLATALFNRAAGLAAENENDARAKRFVEYYEATVRPLEIEAARLFWTANITGKEEDFQKKQEAEEKVDLLLSDPQKFAELKAIKEAIHAAQGGQSHFRGGDVNSKDNIEDAAKIGTVPDPLLAREIDVLYLEYLAKQVDRDLLKKMLAKSNAVERAFNVFRPKVDGKELTDNDVRRILRESTDSAERRATWEAGKKVGPVVVGDLLELVALRNQAARKLGFKNYYVLQLYCGEQSQEQVLKLFDELDELTREPFHKAKAEIDAALAKSQGIAVAELRPWHYHDPFFQEVPAVLGELPESVYKPLDPVKVVPRVLRRHRAAGRRRAEAEQSVRKAGQEPPCVLHRHRPPGRRPRAGERRARAGVVDHLAARVGPQRVFRECRGRGKGDSRIVRSTRRAVPASVPLSAACRTCCTPTPIRYAPRAWR